MSDPHDEIAQLEERIEALAAKIESCRKLILVSRVAIALGGALIVGGLLGAFRLDAAILTGALAAVLGGIVMLGSNASTEREAAAEVAAAEARRAELIGAIDLRVVEGEARQTVH